MGLSNPSFRFDDFLNTTEPSVIELARSLHSCAKPSSCCACTNDCARYGTCCIDKYWVEDVNMNMKEYVKYFKGMTKSSSNSKDLKCEDAFDNVLTSAGIRKSRQYLMITSCPYGAIKGDVEKCADPGNDERLLIQRMPVFGTNQIIYKNRYCARCNQVMRMTYVTTVLDCEVFSFKGGTVKMNDCYLSIGRTNGIEFSHRSCNKTLWNRKCPKDHPLSDLCDTYSGGFAGYRNYHCWLCNNNNDKAISMSMKKDLDLNLDSGHCFLNKDFDPDDIQVTWTLYFNLVYKNVRGFSRLTKSVNNTAVPLMGFLCDYSGTYFNLPSGGCKPFSCPHFYIRELNYCKRLDQTIHYKYPRESNTSTLIFIHNASVTAFNITQYLFLPEHAISTVIEHNETAISMMKLEYSISFARSPQRLSDMILDIFPLVVKVIVSSITPFVLGNRYLLLYNTYPNGTLCLQSKESLMSTKISLKNRLTKVTTISFIKDNMTIYKSYCIKPYIRGECEVTGMNRTDFNHTGIILPKSSEFNFTQSMFSCDAEKEMETISITVVDIVNYVSVVAAWISACCYVLFFLKLWFYKDCSHISHGAAAVCTFAFFADFVFSIALSLKVFDISILEQSCPYISVLMHYGFLSVYSWSFTSVFDAIVTYKNNVDTETNYLHPTLKTYLKSKIIFILLPVLITVSASILHQSDIIMADYQPQQLCWINSFTSRLYLYIIPVVISLILLIPVIMMLLKKIQKERLSEEKIGNGIKTTIKVVLTCKIIDMMCFLPTSRKMYNDDRSSAEGNMFLVYTMFKACRGIVLFCILGDWRMMAACMKKRRKLLRNDVANTTVREVVDDIEMTSGQENDGHDIHDDDVDRV